MKCKILVHKSSSVKLLEGKKPLLEVTNGLKILNKTIISLLSWHTFRTVTIFTNKNPELVFST